MAMEDILLIGDLPIETHMKLVDFPACRVKDCRRVISIEWFKGKTTRKSHISWEDLWFPVDFPLSQPIDNINAKIFPFFTLVLRRAERVAGDRGRLRMAGFWDTSHQHHPDSWAGDTVG